MGPIKVLLVEDHPQMRDALTKLLSEEFEVAEAVQHGDHVLEAAKRVHPEAVVLDISLPGRSGLQVLPELRAQHPHTAIVMLTNHDDPAYRKATLRLGADAFLPKSQGTELLRAVHSALAKRLV